MTRNYLDKKLKGEKFAKEIKERFLEFEIENEKLSDASSGRMNTCVWFFNIERLQSFIHR
jgi:hypothetical protein